MVFESQTYSKYRSFNELKNYNKKLIFKNKTCYFLIILWICALLWGERLIFSSYINSCRFDPSFIQTDYEIQIKKILLIADPQLTDPISYDYAPRGSYLLQIIQFYGDIFMRKSYQRIQYFENPDVVFFLGDLFDGAKILTPEEYKQELQRFNWIFQTDNQNSQLYYVSGNHDIGYQIGELQNDLIPIYKRTFGELNYVINIGGFDFIIISALTLEKNENSEKNVNETVEFVNNYKPTPNIPSILLTHVPLWRPNDQYCGPYRASPPLVERKGYSYTNLLPRNVSEWLIQKLKPVRIFSGDDHDHCTYVHSEGNVREDTILTFSWLQGTTVPGYGLLTLKTSSKSSPELSFRLCYLPSQIRIYFFYMFLLFVSLYTLFPFRIKRGKLLCCVDKKNCLYNIGFLFVIIEVSLLFYIYLLFLEL